MEHVSTERRPSTSASCPAGEVQSWQYGEQFGTNLNLPLQTHKGISYWTALLWLVLYCFSTFFLIVTIFSPQPQSYSLFIRSIFLITWSSLARSPYAWVGVGQVAQMPTNHFSLRWHIVKVWTCAYYCAFLLDKSSQETITCFVELAPTSPYCMLILKIQNIWAAVFLILCYYDQDTKTQ